MLSARAAEKIAKKFYQNIGFDVSDISLAQIETNKNNDWKLYDLLLDGAVCIDVKNARTSLNGHANYVEHCVSRFKNNRENKDVIIAAVLSPYLQLEKIENPYLVENSPSIYFLGETSSSYLLKLERSFTSRFLKVSVGGMNFIPRWFFEFPDEFYASRNEKRLGLIKTSILKLPTLSECAFNPIPAFISSSIDLPLIWENELTDCQVNFYRRIKPKQGRSITLPVLFLALLTHFLEAASVNKLWSEYAPELYRQLIYANDNRMPLGIYDPLNIISDFIDTLSILWANKSKIHLDSFEHFKFNGVGLLQGKRVNQDGYVTILAYCGGFVEKMGKCGNSPLIIGQNECCPHCGKLICEKCGHCSIHCVACSERMKELVSGI